MKIAVLEPYIQGVGGAQKVIGEYCIYLKKRGHEVEIFTQRYSPSECYPSFKSIKINILRPSIKEFSPFAFMKKFKGYDFIIANDWPTHFASFKNDNVIWICYNPKRDFYDLKNFILSTSSFKEKLLLHLKEILFKRLDKKAATKCLRIFPISKTIQKRVEKYYGIHSKNLFTCSIHFDNYSSGSQKEYYLSVARLVKAKRVETIIKAMNYIKNKKIKLYIVGDGPEKETLSFLSKSNKNIKFLGNVDDKTLKFLYSHCYGLIYIPIEEDWGLIPIEAAASRKPIIASNEGGLKETVIDNKTGILLSNPNPKNLAQQMETLFKNKEYAKKMGENAYKHLHNLDWDFTLPVFEKTLENIKNQKKTSKLF